MSKHAPAALAVGLLLAAPNAAAARPCADIVQARLRNASDVTRLLQVHDALAAHTRFVSALADAVYLDPEDPLRWTVSVMARDLLVLGDVECTGDPNADLSAGVVSTGFVVGVEDLSLRLALRVFGMGRWDASVLMASPAAIDPERFDAGTLSGLLGVEVQVTEWASVAFMQVGRTRTLDDDAEWRDTLAVGDEEDALQILQFGVPWLGLQVRISLDDEALLFRELAVRDVPLTEALRGSLVARQITSEDRHALIPKLAYRVFEGAERDLSVTAEVGLEDDDVNLRHARAGVEHLLLESELTRTSYTRIGVRIAQTAALSVHRGQQMRAASDVSAAVGGEYDVEIGLRTPYLNFFFDFGLGFNQVETLDLLPATANRGTLQIGIHLANRW